MCALQLVLAAGLAGSPPPDAVEVTLTISAVGEDGSPVPGAAAAWLFVGDGDDPAAERVIAAGRTDARGIVVLRGLAPRRGWSRPFVAADGFATYAGLISNNHLPVPGEPPGKVGARTVTLPPAAAVRGEIADAATGLPIEGTLVIYNQRWPDGRDRDAWERWTALAAPHLGRRPLSATTDAHGYYVLKDLAPHGVKEPELYSSAIPLPGTPLRYSAEGYIAVNFLGSRVPDTIDLRLEPAASLTGSVIGTAGELIEGAAVHAMTRAAVEMEYGKNPAMTDSTRSVYGYGVATTDANGRYAIDDLPAGVYRLTVPSLNGKRAADAAVAAAPITGVPVVEGAPNEAPPLQLTPGGTVTGRLLDADGSPLTAETLPVRIELRAPGGGPPPASVDEVRPAADGTFAARLPPGVYSLDAVGPLIQVQPRWEPRPWMTDGVVIEEGRETAIEFRRIQ